MTKVMVVDDEHDFADLLASRLEMQGIKTCVVYSGEKALDMLQEFQPEVILLDVNMPGMGGLETLRQIKECSPQTEVILLTADNVLDTAVTGMKSGARDYLLKPVGIGKVIQAIQDARDRSSRNIKRQRLAQTAKMAALGVMATGVAHEINNPIQIVLNETEWIQELLEEKELRGLSASKEIQEATARIEQQSLRCKAITGKLLSLRHCSSSGDRKTEIGETVSRLVDERQERMKELGIRVRTDIPAGIFILGSPAEWEQVFSNLIDNALDAMSEKGGELFVQAETEEKNAVIQVVDTGYGIEPGIQPKIFDPFFSTKDVGQGTGLGLTVCHGIVEAAGGEIVLHSVPGVGSTFRLTVPLSPEPISQNGEIL